MPILPLLFKIYPTQTKLAQFSFPIKELANMNDGYLKNGNSYMYELKLFLHLFQKQMKDILRMQIFVLLVNFSSFKVHCLLNAVQT